MHLDILWVRRMTEVALYDRARLASLWGTLELVARQLVQFAALLVLALFLDPSDFGLMAMVLAFTSFGVLFSDFGLGTALIQRQETTAADETAVMVFNLSLSILLAVALMLAAPAMAAFYTDLRAASLAQLLALTFPLSAVATVPDAMLTKRLAFRLRARVELFASGGGAFIALFLALGGHGVWSLAWQAISYSTIRAVTLWVVSGWRPTTRLDASGLPAMIRFGGYMLMANLIDSIYTRLQAILIGRLAGPREAGLYAMAQSIPQAPGAFVGALMQRVGLPLFSSIQADNKRFAYAFRRVLSISFFVFAPAMLALALLAAPLVQLILGPRWAGTEVLVAPLALATIFWPWHVLNLVAINAAGRSDVVLRIELPKKAMAIGLLIASAPLGSAGMAWSVLAASILSIPFNAYPLGRLHGIGLAEQLRATKPTLLLLGISGLAGLGAAFLVSGTGLLSLMPAAVALASFSVGAILSCHPALAELRRMRRHGEAESSAQDP